jgi:hypothetical protein
MNTRLRLRGMAATLAIAAAVGGAGCKRRPHVEGTVAAETITKAWTAGGFDTTAVANVEAEPWSAGACYQGMVSGVDVLVCEYASDEAMALGEQRINAIWDDESVATGAVAHTAQPSRTIVAIADRAKADPNGRAINKLIKIFQEQK